jgi:hypothetical protein
MRLSGRTALVEALDAVGERLAYDGVTCTLVIVGGAALNLLGIADRRGLVCFKLYASADQTGPDNVHVRDLLALRPSYAELDAAAEWVRTQDAGPEFQEVVAKVVAYV